MFKKFPALGQPDELAIHRIVREGTNVDHLKGQLPEKMLESYALPRFRNRTAALTFSVALGSKVPKRATLDFIPGQLIEKEMNSCVTGLKGPST
ncbi:uncharacterized protein Z519_07216 [Cladophialophora bantiana CBS 173.52]|uniref:Uncharacterized protein n=1 Tax=Cladophialophora bantiana (strain ATCC 10958 / CBS 173.52 / CDC B-1940 / NIH 8579) TaxID=1442370 RepID=A0A0D2G0G2_CLAB1|nr:uncharacterized protein Z519_07216 [Cladophialophora bantiana CBS 173.52]KIW92232.1 hypothetical protein Z519_07216 [Cladophialophora bantiana CBS 173.52]